MNIYKCGFIRIPQFYDYLTLSVAPLSTMKEFVINVLSASNVIIDPCSNNLVLRLEIKQKSQQDWAKIQIKFDKFTTLKEFFRELYTY